MDFTQKYLKYKKKYLELKGGLNSVRLQEIITKYQKDFVPIVYCDEKGFKQHKGECWNDTIQTLLCFTDGIKYAFQRKLFNLTTEEIVELAFLRGRNEYLPNYYKNDPIKLEKLKTKLIEYIKLLQNRLCNYIDPTLIKDKLFETCAYLSDSCPLEDPVKTVLEESPKIVTSVRPKLLRQDTHKIGVSSAIIGLKMIKTDVKDKELLLSHGAKFSESIIIYTLLSIIFLDGKTFLNMNSYSLSIDKIIPENINDSICMYISQRTNNNVGHATGFFKCNNILYYYDDNLGIIPFDWKKYLNFYILNEDKYIPVAYARKLDGPFFKDIDNKFYSFNETTNDVELILDSIDERLYYTIHNIICIKKIIVNDYKNYININGASLIMIESANKNFNNIIKYLEDGLEPTFKFISNNGLDLIQYLLIRSCNNIEIFKLLINKYKLSPNYFNLDKLHSLFYIEKDTNQAIVQLLIDNEADILYIGNDYTILSSLAFYNNLSLNITKIIISELEKRKINIKEFLLLTDGNFTIFEWLIKYDNIELFKYLFTTYKIDYNIIDNSGFNLVFTSVIYNAHEIFRFFKNEVFNKEPLKLLRMRTGKPKDGKYRGFNLLHIAGSYENESVIKILCDLSLRFNENIFVKDLDSEGGQEAYIYGKTNKIKCYIKDKEISFKIASLDKTKDSKKINVLRNELASVKEKYSC